MRLLGARLVAAATVTALVGSAAAQTTFDRPLDEPVPYHADSGWVANRSSLPSIAYTETVFVDGAGWLRLYFGQVELGPGSFLRVSSVLDGETQELDADALKMWGHTTAYLNGDSVVLELVAGPGTPANRVVVERVSWEAGAAVPTGFCGLCGPDDRVSSDADWTARLLPAGCSASIYNEMSCAVSAGHCMGGSMVLQFRVPLSESDCTLNHPPVADQFPIADHAFNVGGIGNDWAAMAVGTNGEGQQPFTRYGEFRSLSHAPPVIGEPVSVWGYGIDNECTQNQVQQRSHGEVFSSQGLTLRYTADVAPGNSGSAVLREGEEILGIVTHCPCPNHGTLVDHPVFAAARDEVCQLAPATAELISATVLIGNLVTGSLFELTHHDGLFFEVDSETQGTRNNTLTIIDAKLPFAPLSSMSLQVQFGPANASPVFLSVQFFNYVTSVWDVVAFTIVSESSGAQVFLGQVPQVNAHVSSEGEIRLRVAQTAREPQTPGGFTKLIDLVRLVGFPPF